MPRRRDHLEVVVEQVAIGEGLAHSDSLVDRRALVLVDVERAGPPIRGEPGLVLVVQVLTRDAAELFDGLRLRFEVGDAVDEQVSLLTLKQEGTDVSRRGERKQAVAAAIRPR